MGAGYDKRVFYNLKDDHARRVAASMAEWSERIVTLGRSFDREAVDLA